MHDVRQNVQEEDATVAVTEDARSLDIGSIAMFHNLSADVTTNADPGGKADAEVDTKEAFTCNDGDSKDKKEPGHSRDSGAEPNDKTIDFTAKVPTKTTEEDTERDGDKGGHDTDVKGNARALDEALEDVTAEVVRTENVAVGTFRLEGAIGALFGLPSDGR
jgi:hypothetical protein